MERSTLGWIALILVIIGGLNWGLFGLFSFDIIEAIFGMGIISDIIYVLVGLSAVWILVEAFK